MDLNKKYNPALVGFIQAAGVSAYCALVSAFFFYLTKTKVTPPGFFGFFLMLALLVFSAAITLLALLLLPSLYLGKKYGYKTGFLTAAAMVGWMLMMSTVTLFFIA